MVFINTPSLKLGVALVSNLDQLNLPRFQVSDFIAVCNQVFDQSFPKVLIEGEVASFKINQGKWVFFDLKDQTASLSCFLPLVKLRFPVEDGSKILIQAEPKLTSWGKFSLTVQQIQPLGDGSIKKSFELLKQKLLKEGLFDPARKRPLPDPLTSIGVISSTQAAGFADFIKIANQRWGGLNIQVAHTSVQGLSAPDQIIRALNYFNQSTKVQLIAILRGGGSADDLACFNDELLTRAVASSRIPVITGIGHEVDESLVDLAADIRAATPSNLAEIITKDRQSELTRIQREVGHLTNYLLNKLNQLDFTPSLVGLKSFLLKSTDFDQEINLLRLKSFLTDKITNQIKSLDQTIRLIETLNPQRVLEQGYAIISGSIKPSSLIQITTSKHQLTAEIKHVQDYQL